MSAFRVIVIGPRRLVAMQCLQELFSCKMIDFVGNLDTRRLRYFAATRNVKIDTS
jgi:hypothetical protein